MSAVTSTDETSVRCTISGDVVRKVIRPTAAVAARTTTAGRSVRITVTVSSSSSDAPGAMCIARRPT